MVSFDVSDIDYERYSNRQLAALPLAVLALALIVLGGWFVVTGGPVTPGIEFVGGTELRLAADDMSGDPEAQIQTAFSVQPETVRSVPSDGAYLVTFSADGPSAAELEAQAEASGFDVLASSEISPSFGGDAQRLALGGIVVAFLGMSAIVFVLFRTFVPCLAVVVSALSDVLVPVAVMNLLGIRLSLGVVAALLMLIGYSVDSDILLNDHVLRRGGSFYESVEAAMETGVSMTLTSLVAMTVMAIAAFFLGVPMLRDIGIILAIGLLVDLMNTYMLNLSLLRWYKFEGVGR